KPAQTQPHRPTQLLKHAFPAYQTLSWSVRPSHLQTRQDLPFPSLPRMAQQKVVVKVSGMIDNRTKQKAMEAVADVYGTHHHPELPSCFFPATLPTFLCLHAFMVSQMIRLALGGTDHSKYCYLIVSLSNSPWQEPPKTPWGSKKKN
ncbi:hypothetical protein Taro_030671, partial [Colocasia esculenta]|nr:hypothetical protein [Colocasia esculenta]